MVRQGEEGEVPLTACIGGGGTWTKASSFSYREVTRGTSER